MSAVAGSTTISNPLGARDNTRAQTTAILPAPGRTFPDIGEEVAAARRRREVRQVEPTRIRTDDEQVLLELQLAAADVQLEQLGPAPLRNEAGGLGDLLLGLCP